MDYNLWQQLILGATKPFRTGANILAQNWGSALTGKDMSQSENQGGFLKWLAGGITPEEQQVINDKPYLSALKSGAGMAATLAPFGTKGLRTAQLASKPLTNRVLQLTSQGALEGGLGGFGLSREGKEVQDTLTGVLTGAGGELFMDYLTNPSFRKMITEASTYVDPTTGTRMYRGALGSNEDVLDTLNPTGGLTADYTPDTRVKARLGENITTLDKTMGRSADEMITVYRGAPNSQGKISPGDFITTNEQLARDYAGTGRVIKERVRLGDILDDLTEPLGEEYIYRPMTGISTIDPLDTLKQEARKYKSVDEFVKAQGKLYRGQAEKTLNFAPDRELLTPDYKGVAFTRDLEMAKPYGENILERYIDDKKVLHAKDLPKETLKKLRSDWRKLGLEPEFNQQEYEVNKALKIALAEGYDAVDLADIYPRIAPEAEVRVLRPSVIRDVEQLIDIWKRAHPNELGNSIRGGFREIIEKMGRDGLK